MTILANSNRNGLPWSTEEDSFLRSNYSKMSAKQVGENLGRSVYAVRSRVRKLKNDSNFFRNWTNTEYDFLRKNYELLGDEGVAEELGRSVKDVEHHAHLLNMTHLRPEPWGLGSEMTMRKC